MFFSYRVRSSLGNRKFWAVWMKDCQEFYMTIFNGSQTQWVCLPQVRDGSRVSQDLPDYWDRVKTGPSNIEIKNVNYTDVGRYILRDQRGRVVSITRMDLTGWFSQRYTLIFISLHSCVSAVTTFDSQSVSYLGNTWYQDALWEDLIHGGPTSQFVGLQGSVDNIFVQDTTAHLQGSSAGVLNYFYIILYIIFCFGGKNCTPPQI